MRYTVRHRRRLKTPTSQAVPVEVVAAVVDGMPYAGAGEIVEVVETVEQTDERSETK